MVALSMISDWDREVDILIAGGGLAGASAAIEAIDLDPLLDLWICEKLGETSLGGNSRASGQNLFLPDDVEKTATYQMALNATNPVEESRVRGWAEGMVELEPWVTKIAAEAGMEMDSTKDQPKPSFTIIEFPELPGADAVGSISTIKAEKSGVWEAFRRVLYSRKLQIKFNHRVVDLVQDLNSGAVHGVVIQLVDGSKIYVKAKRGVILAMGGFENDASMIRNYVGLEDGIPLGTPGNTGDGIRILQRAGAEMRHFVSHSTLPGGLWPAFRVPDQETGFVRQFHWDVWSWIDIGADSKRFIDEGVDYRLMHYKVKEHGAWTDTKYPRVGKSHMIFDEVTRQGQRLVQTNFTWSGVAGKYQWSDNNDKEIQRGVIVSAPDIRTLAEKLDRDPDVLEDTIKRYNFFSHNGRDHDFGREAHKMWPIVKPPFYGIKLCQGIICTSGGGARDNQSRVLHIDGTPIPGLFSAGELGSIHSNLYQMGAYLSEAMVSGRAAARAIVNPTSPQFE